MEKKKCTCCKEFKSLGEFHKNRSRPGGLNGECKICCVGRNKLKTEKNRIKLQDKNKLKETKIVNEYIGKEFGSYKVTEYVGKLCRDNTNYTRYIFKKECKFCGVSHESNLTTIKSMIRKPPTCFLCRESINIHTTQKKCSSCSEWMDATSDNFPHSKNRPFGLHYYCLDCHNKRGRKRRVSKEVRDKEYEQQNIRRKTDHKFRFILSVRSCVRMSIKGKGYSKNTKTYQILGCDKETFMNYIESKWESWMTWENYGLYNGELNYGWDLDHIVPMASGSNYDEIMKLNHYTNFQPLCSKTNRYVKRDKIGWLGYD
jgi:hypothetical protein